MSLEVEAVVKCDNVHAECPVWSEEEQCLYWTDIESRKVWRFDPADGTSRSWDTREKVCAIGFRADGGLLVAFESGISFYDLEKREERRLHTVEANLPSTRLNDGRCDRSGRFVVGGFDEDAQGASGVYSLGTDLEIRELFREVSSANSICFSLDGRVMYFADTPRAEIWAFDYRPEEGTIGDRKVFCGFADQPGLPDGSIIDVDGCLWNAQWNGSRVVRYRPNGEVDQVIEVPCANPTCVAFGGSNLDTLYITTSRMTLTELERQEQPLAGALLAVRPGARGLPESTFGA